MALITRISRLFTADVHAVLDRIEEPEVVLKQAVREMADEVARGEQQLRWLGTEHQQLEQRLDEATAQLAALDDELDLCFQAEEEELARTVVKRKLVAEHTRKQAARQLESTDQQRDAVESRLEEQRQVLNDAQQKTELFQDQSTGSAPIVDTGVSRDQVEVAFLKEKQRRQS